MTDMQRTAPMSEPELHALYMSPATFSEISEGANLLTDLGPEQTKFLFEAALQHGTYVNYWFQRSRAIDDGADSWRVIETKIEDENTRFEQAENAIKLLGEIGDKKAIQVLERALKQEALAPFAIRTLADIGTEDALAILRKELWDDRLGDLVIDSLSQIKSSDAVQMLGAALDKPARRPRAEIALERFSKIRTHPFSVQAEEILNNWRKMQTRTEADLSRPKDLYPGVGTGSFREQDWNILLRRIRDGKCTPLLGPDVSSKYFPSFEHIAQKWAAEEDYPISDQTNFPSVAEFLAVKYDSSFLAERFQDEYQEVTSPDFSDPNNALVVLASLPLPVFVTTTCDDLLVRALQGCRKDPTVTICRWHESLRDSEMSAPDLPTVSNPLVFHLFGQTTIPESLVLTTRDYLTFLINLSKNPSLIPNQVAKALSGSMVLFMGFPFPDYRSRIVFSFVNQFLKVSLTRSHLSILRANTGDIPYEQQIKLQEYMDRYFEIDRTNVYRGTVDEFAAELRDRFEMFR